MKQVDGTHYEDMATGYQPWDIIKKLHLDYWEGSVLKYVLRAGKKPGVLKSTDLRKAIHQLTEYAELVEAEENANPECVLCAKCGYTAVDAPEHLAHPFTMTSQPTTSVPLYRCPKGHDVPTAENVQKYAWHTTTGSLEYTNGCTTCNFSGEYVGLTATEAAELDTHLDQPDQPEKYQGGTVWQFPTIAGESGPITHAVVTGIEKGSGVKHEFILMTFENSSYQWTAIRRTRGWMDKYAKPRGVGWKSP